MASEHPRLVAVAVGNTRTRIGLFESGDLSSAVSHPSTDAAAIAAAIVHMIGEHAEVPVVMSSVNPPADRAIAHAAADAGIDGLLRIGQDILVPMNHALDDAATLGQDRILCAFAAYRRAKQACIVIDAGTAITVDFVDGEGAFQGGAIAPGLTMMLDALHSHTASLPKLDFAPADAARGAFGKDTAHAMILGVTASAAGMVHYLIDRYAQAYEAYPQIIATGGDAAVLFENDELVEHLVPDLQLVGIYEACVAHDEEALADDEQE
jgi:type III pantothenate kinase